MWQINSVRVPTGESASLWGGIGNDVTTRHLGDTLGPEGAAYVLNVPNVGALLLEDTGATPTEWSIRINGKQYYSYTGGGHLTLAIDTAGNANFSGGQATLQVPLIRTMSQTGIVTQGVLKLVGNAPSLQPAWNADPWSLLLGAGFPTMCMVNMTDTLGSAPNCCAQFIAWLKTIQFPTDADELDASWFGCKLCQMSVAGMIAAAFVVIVAVCAASGGTAIPAALAALESATSVAAIAAAVDVSVAAVARLAFTAFAAGGAAMFVAAMIEGVCELAGYCESAQGPATA